MRTIITIVAAATLFMASARATANTRTWDGDASPDLSWQNPANWDGNTLPSFNAPGDDITIGGASAIGMTLDGGVTAGGLAFGADGAALSAGSGGSLTLTGAAAITVAAGVGVEISAPVSLSAGAAHSLAVGSAGSLTLSGPVNGIAIVKTGEGLLAIDGGLTAGASLAVTGGTVTAPSLKLAAATVDNATITVDGGNGVLDLRGAGPASYTGYSAASLTFGASDTAGTLNVSGIVFTQYAGVVATPGGGYKNRVSSIVVSNSTREIDAELAVPVSGGPIRVAGEAGATILFNNGDNAILGPAYTESSSRGRGVMTGEYVSVNHQGVSIEGTSATVLVGGDNALGLGSLRFGDTQIGTRAAHPTLGTYGRPVTLDNEQVLLASAAGGVFDTAEDAGLTLTGKITDVLGAASRDGGDLRKYGPASLVLTGQDSNWWQDTYVYEGRLVMEGKHNAWTRPLTDNCQQGTEGAPPGKAAYDYYGGQWFVSAGAALAGDGEIEGKYVTIQSGGHLQPGFDGIGTLRFTPFTYAEAERTQALWEANQNDGYVDLDPATPGVQPNVQMFTEGRLALSAGSVMDLEFQEPGVSDSVEAYDLVLDGTAAISDAGGIEVGRYNIIRYSGSLTDNGLELDLSGVTFGTETVKDQPLGAYLQEFSFVEVVAGQVDVRIQGKAGDANLDGVVNVGDLGILSSQYGKSAMGWRDGDFDLDGVVDISDLAILANSYGWSWEPPGGGGFLAAAAVPEPASAALLALAAGLLRRRRGN